MSSKWTGSLVANYPINETWLGLIALLSCPRTKHGHMVSRTSPNWLHIQKLKHLLGYVWSYLHYLRLVDKVVVS